MLENGWKRLLSGLLALALVVGMLPPVVVAAEDTETTETTGVVEVPETEPVTTESVEPETTVVTETVTEPVETTEETVPETTAETAEATEETVVETTEPEEMCEDIEEANSGISLASDVFLRIQYIGFDLFCVYFQFGAQGIHRQSYAVLSAT